MLLTLSLIFRTYFLELKCGLDAVRLRRYSACLYRQSPTGDSAPVSAEVRQRMVCTIAAQIFENR
jgi:hypothetical protein